MSLIELEEQLAFARQQGAESYDTVYVERTVKVVERITAEGLEIAQEPLDEYTENEEPNCARLERNGRREIVIR